MVDYQKHNEEVREFLAQYDAGTNPRIRMSIACNPRIFLLNPRLNTGQVRWERYFNDPAVMLDVQMHFFEYRAFHIYFDQLMGPDALELAPYPDFQNVLEPNWFGCPIHYSEKNDPGAQYFLTEENKGGILENGLPDPFGGIMDRAMQIYNYFTAQKQTGYTYKGKPLAGVGQFGLGTDGVFTNACSMRGATDACLDLYEDPGYAHELLSFITESIIHRIRALRTFFGMPEKLPSMWLADDSIALLSTEDYVRHILPYHKKILAELTTGERPNNMHLCGDATRHFPTIVRELRVNYFDTGYPVRHGELLRRLGPEVTLAGGPHVNILLAGPESAVVAETRRILDEVRPLSRRFVIKEANNLSPGTPPEHLLAMYDAVKEYGRFE